MKYKFQLVMLIPLALLLNSCIEITQYVRMDQGGMVTNTRLVIQKALISMAQSYGGTTDMSSLSFTNEQIQQMKDSIPPELLVSADGIDTSLESGLNISLRYPPKEAPAIQAETNTPLFFPYLKDKTLVVDVSATSSEKVDESNQMAAAILSGFKYRLIIDASVVPSPKKATLYEIDSGETMEATLIPYKGFCIVEVSMAFLLSGKPMQLVVE